MMVNTGHFITDEIRDIAVIFLGIHQDNQIFFCHIRKLIFGVHDNSKSIQHFLRTETVNFSVITERRLNAVAVQKLLDAEGAGNCIRVREVVSLNIDSVIS